MLRTRRADQEAIDATRLAASVSVPWPRPTKASTVGVAQAVTDAKVRRLRRLAGLWLAGQDDRWAAIRIDVIRVRVGRRRVPELTHLEAVG